MDHPREMRPSRHGGGSRRGTDLPQASHGGGQHDGAGRPGPFHRIMFEILGRFRCQLGGDCGVGSPCENLFGNNLIRYGLTNGYNGPHDPRALRRFLRDYYDHLEEFFELQAERMGYDGDDWGEFFRMANESRHPRTAMTGHGGGNRGGDHRGGGQRCGGGGMF